MGRIGNNGSSGIIWTNEHGDRRCCTCEQYKAIELFYKQKDTPHGHAYRCKDCAIKDSRANHHRRMKSDPQYRLKKRTAALKSRHGISSEDYDLGVAKQNYLCKICEVDLRKHKHFCHLDHDHATGKLRDFLCTNCNRGLGHFMDSSRLLLNAANYLLEHKTLDGMLKEDARP